MDKNALEAAIRAATHELEKLTYETIRPNQGFKMRTHSSNNVNYNKLVRSIMKENWLN